MNHNGQCTVWWCVSRSGGAAEHHCGKKLQASCGQRATPPVKITKVACEDKRYRLLAAECRAAGGEVGVGLQGTMLVPCCWILKPLSTQRFRTCVLHDNVNGDIQFAAYGHSPGRRPLVEALTRACVHHSILHAGEGEEVGSPGRLQSGLGPQVGAVRMTVRGQWSCCKVSVTQAGVPAAPVWVFGNQQSECGYRMMVFQSSTPAPPKMYPETANHATHRQHAPLDEQL